MDGGQTPTNHSLRRKAPSRERSQEVMDTAKILESQLDSVHNLRQDQPLRRKSPDKGGSREPSQEKLTSTGIFNNFGKVGTDAETYLGSSP